MPRPRAFAAVGLLCVAASMTACASEAPVELGSGVTCIQSDAQMVTFGDVASTSRGAAVVMDSIELVDSQGLELRESYLVPIEGRMSLGSDAYPPDPQFWDRRIDVRGTVIDAGTDISVLFAVAPVGDGIHRSWGYVARYWLDGRLVSTTSAAEFVVAANCSAIDDES